MSTCYHVVTFFELKDGRELRCEYDYVFTPSTWFDPPDCDVRDPVYYLDDEEVDWSKLPKGLDKIADQLYEAEEGQFNYQCTPVYNAGDNEPFFGYD